MSSGLPGEARYGKTVVCPTCGYAMDAAIEATPGSEVLPHGPQVPVGSLLLCVACGALCEVDPDGDMTQLAPEKFREIMTSEDGRELMTAILRRTEIMSVDHGDVAFLHPFQRLGWKESDEAPIPRAQAVDNAPGTGHSIDSLWAWISVSGESGEGLCGMTTPMGNFPMVTGTERLAKGRLREGAIQASKAGRRVELRRYALAETADVIEGSPEG